MKTCKKCGKEIVAPISNQQYCYSPCVPSAKEAPRWPQTRTCEGCGDNFNAAGPGHRFCSRACNPRTAKKVKSSARRYCHSCGAGWVPSSPTVQTHLCPECREQRRERHVFSAKKGWKIAVRKRAGNLCEECGATERDARAYHHVHHILPRSEGGLDTLENGRLLCLACHDAAHGGRAVGGTRFPDSPDLVEEIAVRVVELLTEQKVSI